MRARSLLVVVALAWACTGLAQDVFDPVEQMDFDRPEAWAMKYFASVTMFTGLGAPPELESGQVELAFELGWVPQLSEEQRRVGFNGTKVEDLNKAPVLPRPRIRIGLPARFSLDLAYIPPVEVFGTKSNILAVAVDRPIWASDRFVVGARLFGQKGTIESSFTCTEEDAASAPGSEGNPFGCEEPSSDEVTLDYAGLAVTAGWRLQGLGGATVHVSAAASYLDMEFQVDALTYGFRDRTRLLADGWTYSATAGMSWSLGARTTLGAELFYSPLDVMRDPGGGTENDPLFNARAILRYTL